MIEYPLYCMEQLTRLSQQRRVLYGNKEMRDGMEKIFRIPAKHTLRKLNPL
jgi:hypothetical protein